MTENPFAKYMNMPVDLRSKEELYQAETSERKRQRIIEAMENYNSQVPKRYSEASLSDHKTNSKTEPIISGKASAVILGNNGTGKTHFAWSVIRHWAENGERASLYKAQALLSTIKSADNPYKWINANLVSIPHLVIDEMDKIFESKADFIYLNFLIDRRYEECKQTIVMGNGSKDSFINVLGQSIWSRLTGDGGIALNLNGEDRRK